MKKLFFTIATLSLLLSSCHGDEENHLDPKYWVKERYLESTGFTNVSEQIDLEDREFGIKFKPVVDGSIRVILAGLPTKIPVYRITIWDADQQSILKSDSLKINVEPRGPHLSFMVPMNVHLTAGKEYMVTINSNDWFEYVGTSEATYPVELGDLVITGFGYSVGTGLTFPTQFPTSYFSGDLDIRFQRD